jgi:hypothetical protein
VKRSLIPWLVGLVCVGPFALALALYFGPIALPSLPGSRELIEPPLATPPGWLDGAPAAGVAYRWSLIYARIGACEEPCALDLGRLRQVQAALGRDAGRVQRVYLHGGEAANPPDAAGDDPALVLRRVSDLASDERAARVLDPQALREGRVYLADPLGRLIASYPPGVAQKELLRDLKRLLSVSGTN